MLTKVPVYGDSFTFFTYYFRQINIFLLSLFTVHKNDLTTISINQHNFFRRPPVVTIGHKTRISSYVHESLKILLNKNLTFQKALERPQVFKYA